MARADGPLRRLITGLAGLTSDLSGFRVRHRQLLSLGDLWWSFAFLSLYGAMSLGALWMNAPLPPVIPSLLLAVPLALLSAIDLDRYRLPDALTLPLILAGLLVQAWTDAALLGWRALSAVIGFVLLAGLAALYERLRKRPGLGLGDAKLLAAAGAWLGAEQLPEVLLWSAGAALVCVLAGTLRQRAFSSSDPIPFGPFLAFGIWALWLYGPGAPVWIP